MSQAANAPLRASLASVFGAEWQALSAADQRLIMRDCLEGTESDLATIADGGMTAIQEYRANIGTGNLASYAKVMRVRFGRKA